MNPPIPQARLEIHTIPHIKTKALVRRALHLFVKNYFCSNKCIFRLVIISYHIFCIVFVVEGSSSSSKLPALPHNTSSYHTRHQDYTDQVRSQLCLQLCKMHVSSPTLTGTDKSTYCSFPTVYFLPFLCLSCLAFALPWHTHRHMFIHTCMSHTHYNSIHNSLGAFDISFERANHITYPDVLQIRNRHRFVELLVCDNV